MHCRHCGRETAPDARFCMACGRAIADGTPAEAPAPSLALPDVSHAADIVKSRIFLFMCGFALAPLAITALGDPQQMMTALEVWWGALWAVLIFRFFADKDLPIWWALGILLVTGFGMTQLLDVYLGVGPEIFPPMAHNLDNPIVERWIGYTLGTGIREEITKAIPLVVLVAVSPRFRKPINGLVMGMMSGIGFAIVENSGYLTGGVDAISTEILVPLKEYLGAHIVGGGTTATVDAGEVYEFVAKHLPEYVGPAINNMVRDMAGPFGHSCMAGIFGYFIARAAAEKARRWQLAATGLGIAAVIHGTYDTLVGPSALAGVLVEAAAFFLLVTLVVKARGLSSAHDLAQGMFRRTVMANDGQLAQLAALAAGGAPAPRVATPAPAPAPTPRAPSPAPVRMLAATMAVTPARLRGVTGTVTGRTWRLDGATMLGRDPAVCAILLEEPTVSRQHAVLEVDPAGGGWRVRKLNGVVLVNHQPVEQAVLSPGDHVQAGTAVLVFEPAA